MPSSPCPQVITASTTEAETKQEQAIEKEAQLKIDSAQIAVEKVEAEAALEEAIPALEEAADALNDLRKDDITEVRSFAKPNIQIQRVSGQGSGWGSNAHRQRYPLMQQSQ